MAKKVLSEKEIQFCRYASLGFSPREAAAKSGYSNCGRAATKLMARREIKERLEMEKAPLPTPQEIASGLKRIAFGGIADVIRLMAAEDVSKLPLEELDLAMISELKLPKSGGIEVKLFDRLKAFAALSLISEGGSSPDKSFFEALDKSAEAISRVNEG